MGALCANKIGFYISYKIAYIEIIYYINRTLFFRDIKNRDFYTFIEYISGNRIVIPFYLILKRI